jgi:NADH:ubiquinone reductase (H+-translocating)
MGAERPIIGGAASDDPPHVVVVGGGFGGLTLVRELARAARREGRRARVTLIDRHNHHTFQPLLYQVATAGLQPQDVGISLRAILRRHGIAIRLGEVTAVDPAEHQLHLFDGATVAYDRLVLAAGAITADFGVPGVAEHAFSLKSLADATTMRNEVLRRFEEVTADPARATDGTLTFVISGGGPTGVELAGALAELVDLVVRRDHPTLDLAQVRIVLAEPQDRLLGGFSPRSGKAALRGLRHRGVDVRLGVGISRVTAEHVELTDGQVVSTRLVVWAAGVAASPLAATLGTELGPGRRLPVDGQLHVRGTDDVFAIGDLAASTGSDGRPLPQVAPVAIQQARYLARMLADETTGRPTRDDFRYRDKGTMATIGRAAAVAELPGRIRLRGFVAWQAWLLLHLLMLVGFRNRAAVLFSWIWNYVTYDHAARLILDQRDAATTETPDGPVPRSWAR